MPHCWLLAGSSDHDRVGLLCLVCLQPCSQPATRHLMPCTRLSGASQAWGTLCNLCFDSTKTTHRNPDWDWGKSSPDLGNLSHCGSSSEPSNIETSQRSLSQQHIPVFPTLPTAHRALQGINLAGVGLDLVPILQHLLFCLPQRIVVLVRCLRQVIHLRRDQGQRAQPLGWLGFIMPGAAWSPPPLTPWTCTTPPPQRCSWQRCSRTERGCLAVRLSDRAWRCPSLPGCAAPAAEPAAP